MLCSVPKKLLKDAVRFHGHLGVFLVLGLKAGLYANKKLGKDVIKMHACIETEPFPPLSCFADGVQVATGCTMGKGNIEIRNGDSLSVKFKKEERQLTLLVKPVLLNRFRKLSSMNEGEELALSLIGKSIEDLFEIT